MRFLGGVLSKEYHCSSDMFTSAWLQSICLVLNGFGLSPWSLCTQFVLLGFLGGRRIRSRRTQ